MLLIIVTDYLHCDCIPGTGWRSFSHLAIVTCLQHRAELLKHFPFMTPFLLGSFYIITSSQGCKIKIKIQTKYFKINQNEIYFKLDMI